MNTQIRSTASEPFPKELRILERPSFRPTPTSPINMYNFLRRHVIFALMLVIAQSSFGQEAKTTWWSTFHETEGSLRLSLEKPPRNLAELDPWRLYLGSEEFRTRIVPFWDNEVAKYSFKWVYFIQQFIHGDISPNHFKSFAFGELVDGSFLSANDHAPKAVVTLYPRKVLLDDKDLSELIKKVQTSHSRGIFIDPNFRTDGGGYFHANAVYLRNGDQQFSAFYLEPFGSDEKLAKNPNLDTILSLCSRLFSSRDKERFSGKEQ